MNFLGVILARRDLRLAVAGLVLLAVSVSFGVSRTSSQPAHPSANWTEVLETHR